MPTRLLLACPAGNVLLILDCCWSGDGVADMVAEAAEIGKAQALPIRETRTTTVISAARSEPTREGAFVSAMMDVLVDGPPQGVPDGLLWGPDVEKVSPAELCAAVRVRLGDDTLPQRAFLVNLRHSDVGRFFPSLWHTRSLRARGRAVDAGAVPGSDTDHRDPLARGVADIQARLDELAAGQTEGTGRILTRLDTVDDDLKAGLGRNDAALTRIMRSLNDEAADGPRLFSLVPIDRTMIRPGWTTLRMRLTLYCEHSRWPVPALDPDHPEAGVYTLDVPRDWWVKAVPLIKGFATLIKPFLGISLASIELDLTTTQWTAVKEQLACG